VLITEIIHNIVRRYQGVTGFEVSSRAAGDRVWE
jgi:hypothetical protein